MPEAFHLVAFDPAAFDTGSAWPGAFDSGAFDSGAFDTQAQIAGFVSTRIYLSERSTVRIGKVS